jgi:D-alanine-D-alanine ligase
MQSPLFLLFGGVSREHRVSVASAQHLARELSSCRCWFIDRDGAVHECDARRLIEHPRAFERDFDAGGPGGPTGAGVWPDLERAVDALDPAVARSAVFVLALHGGAGENGTLQRVFEARHLAFTGSGSAASARAFDKVEAKRIVAAAGVRVVAGAVLPVGDEAAIRRALEVLYDQHGALMVKPVADGSSVGLHAIQAADDIAAAAADIARDGCAYMAEALVRGTEVTVGVVDGGVVDGGVVDGGVVDGGVVGGEDGPYPLPLTEIRVDAGRVFDYDGKYLGLGTQEITPAEIAPELARAASRAGVAAHRALGCEGYSRTDFILVGGEPVFLETNTLPGLTAASLIPQQLRAAGVTMAGFLAAQIRLAARRRDAAAAR